MILNVAWFSTLLETLSLTQGAFKPVPEVFTIAGNRMANNTEAPSRLASTVSGALPNVPADFNNVLVPILDRSGNTPSSRREGDSCYVEPYTSPALTDQIPPPFDQAMANIYRYRQQQSVNLGSWFVHEQWMTPSLFICAAGEQISELDIASGWGSQTAARAVLEHHWDTFINQSDFEYLASIGINTVRLPIGYWNLGPDYCKDTPFAAVAEVYQNSWNSIKRAINMAGNSGIGVLVDLHGAVGSQNGQSHSGISDGATNLFNNQANIDKTISVLVFLMQQLSYVTNVVGIQMLNEPQNVPGLTDFYSRAIESMRAVSPTAANFPLYLHDGFDLGRFSDFVANRTDFVVQDHHSYFVFTPSDESESASQHASDVRGVVSDNLKKASDQQRRNLVVDEWSCALTPESISNEPDKNQARRDFCTGQMNVYEETAAGWSFWSYKKEVCEYDPGWCFKAAVGNSLPSTFFSYGQQTTANQSQHQSLINDVVSSMTVPSMTDILAKIPGIDPGAASLFPARQQHVSPRFQLTTHGHTHRFEAIRHRRHKERGVSGGPDLTTQRSIAMGYSDGFCAAKKFAIYDLSKLGFTGQYIYDNIARLGPSVIAPGTEGTYHEWFTKGLQDGQDIVTSAVHS